MSEVFRRLLPGPLEERFTAADLAAAVPAEPPAGRPFLLLNMIATADGRATIEGRTAPLANRADYELFHALRQRVDAVMVGAETVRVEGYGPMDQLAVVVSRSVELPVDRGLLTHEGNRVVIITPSPDRELPPCAASVTYLREADLAVALRRLRERARRGVDRLRGRAGAQRDARAGAPRRRVARRDRAEARGRPRPADDPRAATRSTRPPTSRCCRCTSPAATCSPATG